MERDLDVLRILAAEFYAEEPEEEVMYRYRKLLDKEFAVAKVSARIHITRDAGDNITGFLLTKFYSWKAIRDQLFIGVKKLDGIEYLFLAPLANLIEGLAKEQKGEESKVESVVELAFYWLNNSCRGQGLGSALFNNFLSQATEPPARSSCLIFTTARGKPETAKKGPDIFSYLLQEEKKRNGFFPGTDKVKVTGALIKFNQIVQNLSLGVSDINILAETHEEARATDHLAEKNMMKLIGYSRKMGKVYAKISTPRSLN